MGDRARRLADGVTRTDLPAHRAGGRGLSRRRTPERLPGLVDSHVHLQHHAFDADRDAVIERAVTAGIERLLVPGWDVTSSEAALELARRHAPHVEAAVGVHPHHATALDEAGWAALEALASDPSVRAIGEIGLDHARNLAPRETQREAFDRQLALAAAHALPVIVHDREAHAEVTDALLRWPGARGRRARGVLHAFSGDAAMAGRLGSAGYLVSFALPVAFRTAVGPRSVAAAIEDGRFLVETDAPYLGPDRDRRNEPTTALRVAAEVGRLRDVAPGALVAGIRRAYRDLVG